MNLLRVRNYLGPLRSARPMPANLAAMLRSLLKAKETASLIELRFLREVTRTLPTADANRSSKNAPTITGGVRSNARAVTGALHGQVIWVGISRRQTG